MGMPGSIRDIRIGESLILVTGVLFLSNVAIIAATGDFTLWAINKGLYILAIIFFTLDR